MQEKYAASLSSKNEKEVERKNRSLPSNNDSQGLKESLNSSFGKGQPNPPQLQFFLFLALLLNISKTVPGI